MTLLLLQDNSPLTLQSLQVTSHLNLLLVIKNFLQMSHFLQDVIQPSLFLGLAGNEKGDNISFRFFSFLYNVLMDLGEENFLHLSISVQY